MNWTSILGEVSTAVLNSVGDGEADLGHSKSAHGDIAGALKLLHGSRARLDGLGDVQSGVGQASRDGLNVRGARIGGSTTITNSLCDFSGSVAEMRDSAQDIDGALCGVCCAVLSSGDQVGGCFNKLVRSLLNIFHTLGRRSKRNRGGHEHEHTSNESL